MTIFLASLAGIPPLAGWFAKFVMFRSIIDAGTGWAIDARGDRRGQLGDRVLLLLRASSAQMWFDEPRRGRPLARSRVPPALAGAIALTGAVVVVDRHLPAAASHGSASAAF